MPLFAYMNDDDPIKPQRIDTLKCDQKLCEQTDRRIHFCAFVNNKNNNNNVPKYDRAENGATCL